MIRVNLLKNMGGEVGKKQAEESTVSQTIQFKTTDFSEIKKNLIKFIILVVPLLALYL